jgi:hypothetical protein
VRIYSQEAAMSDPTPATPTSRRAKRRVPRRLIVVLALLAIVAAFEVGIRLIQPDSLTYTTKIDAGFGQYTSRYGTITDPRMVAQWHTLINATPLDQDNVFVSTFVYCNGMVFSDSYDVEFSWHGLPIESVSSSNSSCGTVLWLSSGGLTDPRPYAVAPALRGGNL